MEIPIRLDPLLLFVIGGILILAGFLWLQEEYGSVKTEVAVLAPRRAGSWVVVPVVLIALGGYMVYVAYRSFRW
jgi:hypothetical protein